MIKLAPWVWNIWLYETESTESTTPCQYIENNTHLLPQKLSVTIQLTVVITNPKIVAGLLNIFVAKFRVKYSNIYVQF